MHVNVDHALNLVLAHVQGGLGIWLRMLLGWSSLIISFLMPSIPSNRLLRWSRLIISKVIIISSCTSSSNRLRESRLVLYHLALRIWWFAAHVVYKLSDDLAHLMCWNRCSGKRKAGSSCNMKKKRFQNKESEHKI